MYIKPRNIQPVFIFKMIFQTTLLLIGVYVTCAQAAKLPNYFTKCKKSDPNIGVCMVQSGNAAMAQFSKGNDSYHIQSFNPLKVPELYIDVNGGLYINGTDVELHGFEQAVLKKAKVDFDKKKFEFVLVLPHLNIISQYSASGKILILPITGNGLLNVTFDEPTISYSFEYDLKQRGKNEYMQPKNTVITHIVKQVHYQLDNLFNGNVGLGEQMNKFLNENWKEVHGELGEKLEEGVGEILSRLLTIFFAKVPFAEFFEE